MMEEIKKITDALSCVQQTLVIKTSNQKLEIAYDSDNPNEFESLLADRLYRYFYCGIEENTKPDRTSKTFVKEQNDFVQGLKKSVDKGRDFDEGWTVIEKDNGSTVYTSKGFLRQCFLPGNYLHSGGTPKPSQITYFNPNFSFEDGAYYFYVNGRTVGSFDGSFIVRFYFNVCANGVDELISMLSATFNDHNIPFYFKCPSHSSYFNRSDAAVLYINKRFTDYAFPLVRKVAHQLSDVLKSDVPMFSKRLFKGVGFAENPPRSDQSFGISRCELIASAIRQCMTDQIQQDSWPNQILSHLTEEGFQPDKFFLNPLSKYPYASIYRN